MDTNFNLGLLKTVKTPVFEALEQAYKNLEENLVLLEEGSGIGNIKANDFIHKTLGPIKIISLDGLFVFVSTLEELILKIKQNKVVGGMNIDALKCAMANINNVKFFIEQLLHRENYQTLKLLPEFKKMKVFIGEDSGSFKELFFPKFEFNNHEPGIEFNNLFKKVHSIQGESKDSLMKVLSEKKSAIQKLTLEFFGALDKKDVVVLEEKLSSFSEELTFLKDLKINKSYFILFSIQKVFVESLKGANLYLLDEHKKEIKQAIVKIEKEIKLILDELLKEQEVKLNVLKANELSLKETLILIVEFALQDKNILNRAIFKEVEQFYSIIEMINLLGNEEFKVSIAQLKPEVVSELDKSVIEFKEEIMLITGKVNPSSDFLVQHNGKVLTLANTINGLIEEIQETTLLKVSKEFVSFAEKLKTKQISFNDDINSELSLVLVLFELGISSFVKSFTEKDNSEFSEQVDLAIRRLALAMEGNIELLKDMPLPKMDKYSQVANQEKVIKQIFSEIYSNLTVVEEILDTLFRTEGENIKELESIFRPLNETRGALLMLGKKDIASLIEATGKTFYKIFNEGVGATSKEELRNIANIFGAVVLYVKEVKDGNLEEAENIVKNVLNMEEKVEDYKFGVSKEESSVVEEQPVEVAVVETPVIEEQSVEIVAVETPVIEEQPIEIAVIEAPVVSYEKIKRIEKKEKPLSFDLYVGPSDSVGDQELGEIYLEESSGILEELNKIIPSLKENKDNLVSVRRAFHTLKGSGRMVELIYLGEAGWIVEQTLNRYIAEEKELDDKLISNLELAIKYFNSWVETLKLVMSGEDVQVKVNLKHLFQEFKEINENLAVTIDINIGYPEPEFEEVEVEELVAVETPVVEEQPVEIVAVETPVVEEQPVEIVAVETPVVEEQPVEFVAVETPVVEEQPVEIAVVETPVVEEQPVEVVAVETPVVEEQPVEVVAVEPSVVIVNGFEISKALYELFDQESAEHLKNMKDVLDSISNKEQVLLTNNFARFSHTLSSISKACYLTNLSDVAHDLELATDRILEKNVHLSSLHVHKLKEVVNSLVELKSDLNNEDLNKVNYAKGLIEEVEEEATLAEKTKDKVLIGEKEVRAIIEDEMKKVVVQISEMLEKKHEGVENVLSSVEEIKKDIQRFQDKYKHSLNNLSVVREEIHLLVDVLKKKTDEITFDFVNKYNISDAWVVDHEFISNLVSLDISDILEDKEFADVYESLINRLELLLNEIDSVEGVAIQNIELNDLVKEFNIEVPVIEEQPVEIVAVETPIVEEQPVEIVAVETPIVEEQPVEIVAVETPIVEEQPVEIVNLHAPVIAEKHKKAKDKDKDSIFNNEFVKEIFAEKISLLEDELDQDLFEIAKMEGEDQLEQISQILNNLSDNFDADESNRMKRYLHTLKGGARMAGANKLGGVAHRLESLLDFTETHNIAIFDIKGLLNKEIDKIKFLMEDPTRLLNEKELHWLDGKDLLEEDLVESNVEAEHVDVLDNEFVKEIFAEKISLLKDELDKDLFEIAKMEGEEQLEQISQILNNLSDNFDADESNRMKRYLHTLKGGARMAGANKLGGVAHRLESLLDFTETHNIAIFDIKEVLDKEIDKIKFLMLLPSEEEIIAKASWLDGVESQAKKVVKENKEVKKVIKKNIAQAQIIKVNSNIIDTLVNDTNEIRLTRNNLEDSLENYKKYISDVKAFSFKLQQILKEVEVQAESQIQSQKEQMAAKAANEVDFDPLEFDRFTRLQELTRFMAETVSDINDSVIDMDSNLKHQSLVLNQQGVVTNNVVTDLMKIRLVPVEILSEELYAITRKTAAELGKKAIIEIIGEKTELDRIVLEKIKVPLHHLLRNSLAHGIEMPEDRANKGKKPIGKITLDVKLEGNYSIIRLKDDGAGINVEKVKKIGIEKGLIKENVNYTQKDIVELIFAPGFSTADTVNQVSGRGVGMDVVKSEINSLNGSVSINTEKDKGSEFVITLPLSMATSQSMLVEVGDNLIAIPAMFIEEVMSVKDKHLTNMYDINVLEKNNGRHPFYYLGHLLGGPLPQHIKPEIKNYNSIILISYLGETVAVHVDKIINTSEVLVKQMGPQFAKISGVMGATILGSGRQGLIINPVLLKQHWEKHIITKTISNLSDGDKGSSGITEEKGQIIVMVVDDSLTIRKASTKVLERNHFKVILAKDGEDALEQLQIQTPDIILSDIEMPRMDGFELLKNLKNSEKYRNIPVIMITSRTADKHKEHAYSLGANGFLGKPFQEDELIKNINQLTNQKNHA